MCTDLDSIELTELPPTIAGREDCLATRGHGCIYACASPAAIGCRDRSPKRHASQARRRERHPIIRSAEPGEDWS